LDFNHYIREYFKVLASKEYANEYKVVYKALLIRNGILGEDGLPALDVTMQYDGSWVATCSNCESAIHKRNKCEE
jgi:hypothetical protein